LLKQTWIPLSPLFPLSLLFNSLLKLLQLSHQSNNQSTLPWFLVTLLV
jgi:hypothetical protein